MMRLALSFVSFVSFVPFVSFVSLVGAQRQEAPTQAQQKPVFRGGTHFVRVDAYPTSKEGRIVEGLKPEDFEITEDGKPQAIESFDYISFPTFTPDTERHDPASQRAGFDMAADPRYRVFVILVDMALANTHPGSVAPVTGDLHYIQQPLVSFLDRVLGPQDLYGFLTSRNTAKDLVLGQKTTTVEAQIADLLRSAVVDRDDADDELDRCGCGQAGVQCDALFQRLKSLRRLDGTYTSLESLVTELGSLREERKNVIFVSNRLPRTKPNPSLLATRGPTLPKAGITHGKVGIGDQPNALGGGNELGCAGELQRLVNIDFDSRYLQLLDEAKHANVAFYVITPEGLTPGRADDNLIALANNTDGLAIVNTNDLTGGIKKIADDLSAYYVLGYYTTNTTWDGGIRTIKVKLKPSGATIRARRQYRAPTLEEMNALAAKPAPGTVGVARPATDRETALAILERASRPFASYTALNGNTLTVVTELTPVSIQNARWKSGADVQITASTAEGATMTMGRGRIEPGSYTAVVPLTIDPAKPPARISVDLTGPGDRPANDWLNLAPPGGALVGDPIAYRSASRVAPRPVAAFEFARNERIKIDWPVLAPALDRREARLLDHSGKPLPVDLPLSEDPARHMIKLDMSLSGLPRGDYLFELTVGAGGTTERHLLAVRIKP
jgi:VWFA-related protein